MTAPNVGRDLPARQVRFALAREFAALAKLMQSEFEDPSLLDQVGVDLAEALAVSLAHIAMRLAALNPQQRREQPLVLLDHQTQIGGPLARPTAASLRRVNGSTTT